MVSSLQIPFSSIFTDTHFQGKDASASLLSKSLFPSLGTTTLRTALHHRPCSGCNRKIGAFRASLIESPVLWAGRVCVYYALLKAGLAGSQSNPLVSETGNDVPFSTWLDNFMGKSEDDEANRKRKLVSKWHPTTKGTLKRSYRVPSKSVGQRLLKAIAALLSEDDHFVDASSHKLALQIVCATILQIVIISLPFISFQAYGFYNICQRGPSDELRPWCKSRLPRLYGFIQDHYWGVGFLRYFQLKQLPNFFLASPVLWLAVSSIVDYTKSDPKFVLSLGFLTTCIKSSAPVFYSTGTQRRSENIEDSSFTYMPKEKMHRRGTYKKNGKVVERATGSYLQESNHFAVTPRYQHILVLPFVLHLAFLVAVAFFVMHVQVATRFLSSSPPIYWFISRLSISGASLRWSRIVWVYFISYILLGSLLFSNFYPFT